MKTKTTMALGLFLLLGIGLQAQEKDTYFKDVTQTALPLDADLHALGSTMADMDNDGDLDIIVAVEHGVNRLYVNDGSGRFTYEKGAFGKGAYDSEHAIVTDFNNDGTLDVVFVAEDDRNHQLFYGIGNHRFKEVSERLLKKSEGNALAVADFNMDGLPDILIGNSGELREIGKPRADKKNTMLINNPEKPGYFLDESKKRLPGLEDDTQGFGLADVNGDGYLDMVVANETPPNRLLINQGNGTFKETPENLELLVPMESRQVLIADYDQDGDMDLLLLNLTSNNHDWDKDPQMRILMNNGTGKFTDETNTRLPYNTFSTYEGIIIDLNQDGAMDVVVGPVQIPGFVPLQFRAYINDGKGHFTDKTLEYIPSESVGLGWGMSKGDVDGDGKDDLFLGGWGTQARLLRTKKH